MVTRGRIEFVQRSITCFLNQTYQNRELVIVEDKTNHLEEFIAARQDPRIRYESVRQANVTLGELRNRSLEMASGEFVAVWDDDDWYHPSRLAIQFRHLLHSRADVCMLSRESFAWPERELYVYSNHRLWKHSSLASKAAFARYPALRVGEDTEQIIQMLKNGAKLCMLNAPDLYIYCVHDSNISETWLLEAAFEQATAQLTAGQRALVESRLLM